MTLNLLLICRRHLLLTVDRANSHSLLSAGLSCKVFFFFLQFKSRTHCLFPHWDDPFSMQHLSLCETILVTFLVPPVSRGHLSSPHSICADWENCLGTAEPFFPCSLCLFFTLWPQGAVKGDWWAAAIYEHMAVFYFLEVSLWPSFDTCSAPGTNINQSFEVGTVTFELSGDGCNKKGNYWLTFKGTGKKTEQKDTIFWMTTGWNHGKMNKVLSVPLEWCWGQRWSIQTTENEFEQIPSETWEKRHPWTLDGRWKED